MASHTGQKWSRFFYSTRDFFCSSWHFFFKLRVSIKSRSFLFKSRCFNSSRDLFYPSWDVSIQVEIVFLQVEMLLFKSRFFHVEIFISSREYIFHVEVFISSRGFYLMSTFFFSRGEFFFISIRDFCSFRGQVDISQFKARSYPGVLVAISWQW